MFGPLGKLPLVVQAGLGFLAYRYLTHAPPLGSTPPQAVGNPAYAKVTSKTGLPCETWTWTTPQYAFVVKCNGKWLSVVQAGSKRVPVKSNATGFDLEALKQDWL
jgi:hypothetical protein